VISARTAILVLLLPAAVPSGGLAAPAASFDTPQIEARVDALLAQMTLEEKVGQLNQLAVDSLTGRARPPGAWTG
jgi:hypothetical protein